ncbi:uncharacterized protein UTRI_03734 [Ustilago trichophora]|uniref:Uncharacterized protein n=1 Tax=Ustilago trichophora TaxID=86804 RepID=A0A5C3E4H3_9BASI|nr:uncharacterized protein UTRI_03734 [Ustilago trichophora]
MDSSLGAVPPRNQHCFQDIPASASSSETTSPDPMFSTSSTSSHTSTSNTIISNHATQTPKLSHLQQQPVATSISHRSSRTEASTDYTDVASSSKKSTTSDGHDSPEGSRFDSLHELLERAGYKETRVVTPDRQTLAGMFAKKLATPPRKTRLVDDFSSDSPSLAASELRRAVQKSKPTPKAATSKSLPSRNYKLAASPDSGSVPPLPGAPAQSSTWWSNVWLFGPGTIFNDAAPAVETANSPKQDPTQDASPQSSEAQPDSSSPQTSIASPAASKPASTPALASTSSSSTRPAPPKTKRTASNNPVWSASVAYRSSKSRTAPVRKSAAISSDVMSSDAAAEDEWKALANNTAKRRPGLVDAFTSPTKKAAPSEVRNPQDSPSRQRKWKKERAAWRESLGDLQAMMDQSRLRREASAAAAAAAAAAATATSTGSTDSDLTQSFTSSPTSEANSLPSTRQSNDEDAVTKLLSGPALPFLSTDPAVAPRNGSCTRPTHLSMRRMKSVEVLSRIIRERRTVSSSHATAPSSSSTTSSVELDTESGQISPTLKKRSTPPRLTVSSPRGISSPKEIALEGNEFEPMSWSPGKSGAVIISNRRVQKKPRSKLRHVSSGSDLRSAAAEQGLKMPKRGRSKNRSSSPCSSPNTSPSKMAKNRGPVAVILRDSVGSLSRGNKVQALRTNIHVFDESELSDAIENGGRGGVDDSPTRMRSKCRPQHGQPVVVTHAQAAEVEDIFRPSPSPNINGTTMRKKDFSARITRTSKIMRLIEEAENTPSIASMISNPPSATGRKPLQMVEAVPQPIARTRDSGNDNGSHGKEEKHGLSSSLSRKSKERMHTITRVLGQRQPVAN